MGKREELRLLRRQTSADAPVNFHHRTGDSEGSAGTMLDLYACTQSAEDDIIDYEDKEAQGVFVRAFKIYLKKTLNGKERKFLNYVMSGYGKPHEIGKLLRINWFDCMQEIQRKAFANAETFKKVALLSGWSRATAFAEKIFKRIQELSRQPIEEESREKKRNKARIMLNAFGRKSFDERMTEREFDGYEEDFHDKTEEELQALEIAYQAEKKEKRHIYNLKYWSIYKEKFRKYKKEYYAKNHEKIIAYHKEYYIKNRETISKKYAKYRAQNLEKIKEKQAEYVERNREKIYAKQKIYRKNNTKKIRKKNAKYRANNLEKLQAYQKEYIERNREKLNEKRRLREAKYREKKKAERQAKAIAELMAISQEVKSVSAVN